MAHIKIGDISPRTQITSTTGQTDFTFLFPIFVDSDLDIYVGSEEKALSADYTVTGAGNDNGGTVTFNSGLAEGDIVTIIRDMPLKRTSDYQTNGDLLANTLNDDLDKLTMSVQQVEEMHESRTVMLAPMAEGSLTHIDGTIADRANKYIAFTANGDVSYTAGTSSDIVPGQTGVDLVAASTEQEGRDAIDVYSQSEVVNAISVSPTITSPTIDTTVSGTAILDDDTMANASATTLATSESIKAYVDALASIVNASNMPRVSQRVCIWEGSNGTTSNGIFSAPTVDRQQYTMTPSSHFNVSSGTFLKLDLEWQCVSAEDTIAVGDVLPFDNTMHDNDQTSYPIWYDNEGDCSNSSMRVMFRVGDYGNDSNVFHLWTIPGGSSVDTWYQKANFALYARIYYTI